mmetsp:Transcript_4003/g.11364  ORF Transcript_4003/g.11364 Transcript_4003/m.11364 type:complete len:202 (+) Transcript_4003:867-1472(+)
MHLPDLIFALQNRIPLRLRLDLFQEIQPVHDGLQHLRLEHRPVVFALADLDFCFLQLCIHDGTPVRLFKTIHAPKTRFVVAVALVVVGVRAHVIELARRVHGPQVVRINMTEGHLRTTPQTPVLARAPLDVPAPSFRYRVAVLARERYNILLGVVGARLLALADRDRLLPGPHVAVREHLAALAARQQVGVVVRRRDDGCR